MTRRRHPHRRCLLALFAGPALALAACGDGAGTAAAAPAATFAAAPPRLADTGLYADFASRRIAADALPYAPQYPLWTDGAAKRRWLALPPGAAIDASCADAWQFPVGTRLWKEFAFGRAVETRFMHRRADGSWLYATYLWSEDGSDARLAPADGVRNACATADGQHHDVPSQLDCRLCHEGGRTPVLGVAALQLSPDRDPLAPHGEAPRPGELDLPGLHARGLVRGLDPALLQRPPRVPARTPAERAALGYLHGNCSSCHNGQGPLQRLGLRFDVPVAGAADAAAPALATALDVPSHFTRGAAALRLAAGAPDRSVVVQRLAATDPLGQMPPFGRHLADRRAIDLLRRWLLDLPPAAAPVAARHEDLPNPK